MNSELLNQTLSMIKNRPRSCEYLDISKGTGIPVSWLKALVAGRIADPGIKRVETVRKYLNGQSNPDPS